MAADYASIIDRASAAATPAEECDVIRDAVSVLIPGQTLGHKLALLDVFRYARDGYMPRAFLLGVVASLVPEGLTMAVFSGSVPVAKVGRADQRAEEIPWSDGPTAALAALIAICRALQEQEGAR